MAQKVYQWQKRTPERFRVKPLSEQNQGPPPAESDKAQHKLTAPKTPNLKAKDRKRPLAADCVSREEQEKMLEKEIKRFDIFVLCGNHNNLLCSVEAWPK